MNRILMLLWLALLPVLSWANGLKFSEEMHGYTYFRGEYRQVHVYFNVVINNVDAWRADQNYPAAVTGSLYLDRLPAQAVAGTLQILAPAPGQNGRLLTYRFNGGGIAFVGLKHVHDDAGLDMMDDVTTLHGVFLESGQVQPTISDLLYQSVWTSELHFEWWKPIVLWNFSTSFKTIATPWYEDLLVKIAFLKTVFGNLAKEFFPWAI